MALTKAEAAKLTNDVFLRGVIQTIITESRILAMLPFDDIVGTALVYNRETTNPAAAFYDVGDTWTEATPTFTQVSAPLKIMGGDADVDNFLQQTYRNPNDLAAEVIALRAKSVAYAFNAAFITGDVGVDPKSFDGLRKTIGTGSQSMTAGANGAALTLDMMDQLIDMVKPGRPDILLLSRRSRRKLSSLRRASGNLLETDRNKFGLRATFYDGIELVVDDNQPDNEVEGASGAVCSSIYALKLGKQGWGGLQNEEIQTDDVGILETKDAKRWRIKWYASVASYATLGSARLRGINAS